LLLVPDAPQITEKAVEAAVAAALTAISAATDSSALKAARTAHSGEASALAGFNAAIRNLPGDQKAAAGQLVGGARARVNEAFAAQESVILAAEEAAQLTAEAVDVTAVPTRWRAGARHPLSLLMEQMSDLFISMGWEIGEGPELEHEWFNFDALNFDEDHPARALQDTFFVDPVERHLVLRTHTSPVQIRSLLSRPLPVYVAAVGAVYRTDEVDVTHTPVFHQIEGIAIDKGLTMANLRGTLEHMARSLFGAGAQIRLRPNYFPFTEPSAEIDCRCWVCGGNDPACRTCGGTGWIELGGSGMVNQRVLRAAGVDTDRYTGFAFGLGIERSLMLRHGVGDMHDIVEGDARVSQQFGMEI
jgi:phenylalanyl-tRNA synthetase alpha chain